MRVKDNTTTYPTFNVDASINEITFFGYLEYKYSLIAVKFKNYYFKVAFDKNQSSYIKFKICQFIVHKVFRGYSFSRYVTNQQQNN